MLKAESNPLLRPYGIPAFDEIKPEHVVPAVETLVTEVDEALKDLGGSLVPTWKGLMLPLEQVSRRIESVWGPVTHLLGVKNSTALREAYAVSEARIVALSLRLSQNKRLYGGYKRLLADAEQQGLDAGQQRILELAIREARLSGIELEGEARDRFNAIAEELSSLQTKFSNNVLDATKAFVKIIKDSKELDGLPESALALMAQNYNQRRGADDPVATPQAGPWTVTLDFPSFSPVMKHSRNRGLREEVYRAYNGRAAKGPWDNTALIEKILKLRQEKAGLLGFKTFGELSVARKMAGSVAAVDRLLADLNKVTNPKALKEHAELVQFAASQGHKGVFENWDSTYYAERMREQLFAFSDEDLRPYFPLEQALGGLFSLAERLLGVSVKAADGEASSWHPDVRFFKIFDRGGEPLAAFYLDPYTRSEDKRGGAWMNVCLTRCRIADKLVLPVAYLICNGTPPSYDKPSLLTFREVETLFHEFGHGLQHMLTKVDHYDASGLNGIEWDAVELASQFMENWCYHKPTLMGLTRHYKTGEKLPEELFLKIKASAKFRAASDMARQLHFAMLDMEMHHRFTPTSADSIFELNRTIAAKTLALAPVTDDRFLCSFSHIFAGGYAAGYYSYKWAEVLSADAFSAFEEVGLDDEKKVVEVGRRYRETVLALGGAVHPIEVFKRFRGRDPQAEALLRHSGLLVGV